MTPEQNEHLDHLLSLWHWWAKAEKDGEGFDKRAVGIGDARDCGLQFESQVDQQYARAEAMQCRTVDNEVRRMADPHRTAIYCDARNLVYGIAVWTSPRLPQDPDERAILVRVARQTLTDRLISAGVMDAALDRLTA